MDNVAYLNQISSKKKPSNSPLDLLPKLKLPLIGLVSLIIIIVIVSKIIGALNARETDFTYRLNYRASNFTILVDRYKSNVKSSELRAAGSSLSSVLTNLTTNLPNYFQKAPQSTVYDEEFQIATEVKITLEDAKLNGVLDRTYARQMAYAIKILLLLIDQIESDSKDVSLNSMLDSTKSSLNSLLPSFSNFSEY